MTEKGAACLRREQQACCLHPASLASLQHETSDLWPGAPEKASTPDTRSAGPCQRHTRQQRGCFLFFQGREWWRRWSERQWGRGRRRGELTVFVWRREAWCCSRTLPGSMTSSWGSRYRKKFILYYTMLVWSKTLNRTSCCLGSKSLKLSFWPSGLWLVQRKMVNVFTSYVTWLILLC